MQNIQVTKEDKLSKLKKVAAYIRTTTLGTIINAKNGHIGGNMSSVELLTALYFGGVFNFDPSDSKNENRDRVLIRGHEGPLRYTIFALLNYIKEEELKTYRSFGTRLHGHEDMHTTPGVDITPSGSLGMLLSYGVGSALANKDKGLSSKTIVFLGDGEEQEGNISEAARHATTIGLDNLICILDQNKKQLSRPTIESDGHDIRKIWEGYGWNVVNIKNGNDLEEVLATYEKLKEIAGPTLVIASTIKGYGVTGAEEHYSGYHTYSSAPDKHLIMDSYNDMQEYLAKSSLDHNNVSQTALELISRPSQTAFKVKEINPALYDIRTLVSKVSPEIAHENYLLELKKRTINDKSLQSFYYITPDLYRKSDVELLGFKDFTHFIDTGIREQHTIAMCHGISVENPNARICVCFGDAFAYRALDQINAAAMGGSNMLILGVWPGIQGAQNGKTHQTVGQSAALMAVPGVNFYEPADAIDLYNVFSDIFIKNNGVNYVRLSKEAISLDRNKSDERNIGAYFVHESDKRPKALIISSGFLLENSVVAAQELEMEYNIPVSVINVVNLQKFEDYAQKLIISDCPILTIYNGSSRIMPQYISEAILLNPNIPRPEALIGHGFEMGTTGSFDDLVQYYGFDKEAIKSRVLKMIKK